MQSFRDYLFNLHVARSSDAKRLWKNTIKEQWNNKCAYCDSDQNLTLDHVVPRSKGGIDYTENVVCCCNSCNVSKSHTNWEEWYSNQPFYDEDRKNKIKEWIAPEQPVFYTYKPRSNKMD